MIILRLFVAFFVVGLVSFGGGYATIPVIQREVVSLHHWLSAREFVEVVAVSQMTPGPVALNMATFTGYRVAGVWGGVVATLGVVLPSMVLSGAVFLLVRRFQGNRFLQGFFSGVRPVVLVLLLAAAFYTARGAELDLRGWLLAGVALLLSWRFRPDPVLILLGAAALGLWLY